MHRVYEIFEVPPNGSPQKVNAVRGVERAKSVLQGLAQRTSNECFASDAKTHQIVMQLNVPRAELRRIFMISYDEEIGVRRAELLRSHDYGVISAIGNEAAKVLLSSMQHYDLFIVGHGAPPEIREEMASWLSAQYPTVKILAVNPPGEEVLGADYNLPDHPVEKWLPIVSTVCEHRTLTRGVWSGA